ncbi:MAG: cell division protein FtsB [Burkholderiales bacterium]|jgi:cell division protein FtsB|nr:cell division protein FtsB [Burkholderiales bacterium]
MKILSFIFLLLIVALQYPIWLGKGGWLQVRALQQEIDKQQTTNALLRARNDALAAEVTDLKSGLEAVEERARAELGMIKKDEVFFQFQASSAPTSKNEPQRTQRSQRISHAEVRRTRRKSSFPFNSPPLSRLRERVAEGRERAGFCVLRLRAG